MTDPYVIFGSMVIIGMVGMALVQRVAGGSRRPKIQPPADPSIPSREKMRQIWGEVLAGNQAAAEIWLRGAIYWESQLPENGGFTAAQALVAALDPGIRDNVRIEIK